VLLVLSISGVAAAALVTSLVAPTTETVQPDAPVSTVTTFEDVDGDNVDDDCDDAVVVDEPAAAAAEAAVDLDGDGVISTTEAAHSDRIGGVNCNHGGYVSNVANDPDEALDETVEEVVEPAPAACAPETEPVEPVAVEPTVDEAPNAHGKAVSTVAQGPDVGGKNCNHGGAVSQAAKKDHQAQQAQKEQRALERAAAKAAKSHGRGHHKP
jgi:hypothetical protein